MYEKVKRVLLIQVTIAVLSMLLAVPAAFAAVEEHYPWEMVFSQEGVSVYDSGYIRFYGVAYGNGVYVAIGDRGGSGLIYTSTDGKEWQSQIAWGKTSFNGVKYIDGMFYAYGIVYDREGLQDYHYGNVWESVDGVNWSNVHVSPLRGTNGVEGLAYGNGVFVAIKERYIYTSTDNLQTLDPTVDNYDRGYREENYGFRDVAYGNGVFVATGLNNYLGITKYSYDGVNWFKLDMEGGTFVKFINGHFVIGREVGIDSNYPGKIWTSPDGVNWREVYNGRGSNIAYGNGGYVIPLESRGNTGGKGIYYSPGLDNDISRIFIYPTSEPYYFTDVAAGNDGFVVVGDPCIYYCSFENMAKFPRILNDDVVHLQVGVPFEYSVETANLNPNRLLVERYESDVAAELPPGIKNKRSGNNIAPLAESKPHFAGTPTSEGEWTVMLYAAERGEFIDELYARKKITFKVAPAKIEQYTLSLVTDPPAGGTVTGAGIYDDGGKVTITAIPNEGYQFVKWIKNGEFISDEETYVIDLTEDMTITAEFAEMEVDKEDVTDLTPSGGPETVGSNKIWTIVFNQPIAHSSINAENFQVRKSTGKEINTGRGFFDIEPDECKMQVKPPDGGYEPGEYILRISGVVSQSGKALARPVVMRFIVR